jgi:predicted MPP superfamily phosphohydrolase
LSPRFLFGLSAALHLLIAARVAGALPAPWSWLLGAWLAASALLVPLGLMARRYAHPPASDRLAAAGLFALGLFSSLGVLMLLRELVLLAGLLAGADLAGWRLPTAAAVALGGPLLAALGLANTLRLAAVREVEVPIAGLPAALHGFTIAQITDLHVGPTIRRGHVAGIVERVNALEADLVAITGDLVDGPVRELAPHVAPLAGLRARHGAWFVTGNHEYYAGAAPWIAEVRRLGIRVLMNEHVVLAHEGGSLVLAGVADWSAHHFEPSHRSDPALALAGAPPDAGVRVLLAHQPRTAAAAAAAGFDLQVSGHTHGGQFFPWIWFVRLQQPFIAGLHRVGRLWVYVSRGTGYWGPPKRVGAPAEITRLRLVPG